MQPRYLKYVYISAGIGLLVGLYFRGIDMKRTLVEKKAIDKCMDALTDARNCGVMVRSWPKDVQALYIKDTYPVVKRQP